MNEKLQAAIDKGKEKGKLALYFGCWNQAGHFLHGPGGASVRPNHGRPSDFPWDECIMDAGFLRNGKVPDKPDGRVFWTCGGADAFWYAFYWWDRSVDKRGACNSGIYVRGFGWPEAQSAFEYGCAQFPNVVRRQKYPLVLQERNLISIDLDS
jgi:hypothetical protein